MAQDARAPEVAKVGIVVLDRVEDDGQARELATDGDRRLDAIHLPRQPHIHQDRVRLALHTILKSFFAAAAVVQDAHAARRLQPFTHGRTKFFIIFDQKQVDHLF